MPQQQLTPVPMPLSTGGAPTGAVAAAATTTKLLSDEAFQKLLFDLFCVGIF
jgi:hypothetical protein